MANAVRQYLPLALKGRHVLELLMRSFIVALRFCLLIALPAVAHAGQDMQVISRAIDDFLRIQIQGLPGSASYSIGAITNTERLGACQNLQVSLPRGGRLWGKSNVVVRCDAPQSWTLYVPVRVRVVGNYLVSGRALRQGQVINAQDVATQNGDLTELPGGTLTELDQALGRTLEASIGAGYPLRGDLLRQAVIIQQGQSVRVVSRGPGFEVANEGQALNNAAQGQLVRVRLANGQLVSGIATGAGMVTVAY